MAVATPPILPTPMVLAMAVQAGGKAGDCTRTLSLAEHLSEGIFEVEAYLSEIITKPKADTQIESGPHQGHRHGCSPQKVGDGGDNLQQHVHSSLNVVTLSHTKLPYYSI